MALYNADGQISLTVTDGSTRTGAQAPDGSYYVVINDGTTYKGLYHSSGALNAVISNSRPANGSLAIKKTTGGWTTSDSPGAAPLFLVANRGIMNNNTRTASAANLTVGETRMNMKTGNADLSEMRFIHSGFYLANGTGIETAVGNDQSIEFALEWGGVTKRVTFGGANVGTIVNNVAEYISDPIFPSAFGLSVFSKNTAFNIRSRRTVALAAVHAKHGASAGTNEATYFCDGVPASQLLGTGAMSLQAGGATASAELGPNAIIGRAVGTPDIAILAIGDSIMDGSNDTNIDGDGSAGGGWIMRAAWSVNSRTIPIMKMSVGGSLGQNMAAGMTKRIPYFKYCTHAICNYGTNDLVGGNRTAAQTLTDLRTIWAALKTAGVQRVEQVLIIPRTTSTDSWATTANQTVVTNFETNGSERFALNASIVSNVGSNGLDNYLNLNTVTADGTALDKWAVTGAANYATNDGTHPSPAMHALMATPAAARMATWS